MKKLNEMEKMFYMENPEKIEELKLVGLEAIEKQIERCNAEIDRAELLKKYERLWDVATSYWIIPEAEDYFKLLDKVYKYGTN